MQKVVIISAPSGAGKTTLVKYLLQQFPQLEFSISACSRPKRPTEQNGVDYYFISIDEFKRLISENKFIEWEEVYPGQFYGTLKSEIERIWNKNHIVLFDVDVKGGINLKKIFQQQSISIFIAPPSIEELEKRLKERGTESEQSLKTRIEKAKYELTFAPQFDYIIINDKLNVAKKELFDIISNYINQ